MMWSKLSVRTKILALVSIPLIALSASVVTLQVVTRAQQRAEDAVQQSFRVRSATQELKSALENVNNALMLPYFGAAQATSGYDRARAALDEKIGALRNLVRGDANQLALVGKLPGQVDAQVALYQELGPKIFSSGKGLASMSPQLLAKATLVSSAPTQTLSALDSAQEMALAARSAAATNARKAMQLTIILSAVLGIGGGLGLSFFVARGFVRRIAKVSENARRLANSEPVDDQIPGQDEIGKLSGQLVEAAHLLSERERAYRTATEEAERANLAKSEFLSRMSHELRTPLNSILGFGQLLEMGTLEEQDRESVELILKGGRHLLSLINEVLDIARIEAGEFTVSVEPVNLAEVVAEVSELMRPLAASKDVTIYTFEETRCGSYVMADFQRLKQVLLNLVSNAAKYNRHGGSVRIACHDPDNGRVALTVADSGRGLTSEQISRLFTPFERLDADKEGVEGTGLGLALAKRLAEAMGGTIEAESELGDGSVFTLELERAEKPAEWREPDGTNLPTRDGSERTVLYIEDNLSNVRLIERVIARRPRTTLLTAMQGRLGVELARQHMPDVILLDLNLPDISGKQVLELLAADHRTAEIPVIIVTADAMSGRRSEFEGLGVTRYATKPFDVEAILGLLDEVLSEGAVV